MFDVTVEPDDTSEVEGNGRPDQNHWTLGLGRPEIRKKYLILKLYFTMLF